MTSPDTRPQERSHDEDFHEGVINILLLMTSIVGIVLLVQFSDYVDDLSKVEPIPVIVQAPDKPAFAIGGPDLVVGEEEQQQQEQEQVMVPKQCYYIRPLRGGWKTRGILSPHEPGGPHRGVDIACEIGTPIVSAAKGLVILSNNDNWGGGYGKHIIILHPNGAKTLYGHLSKLVTYEGDYVKQGDLIGLSGNTGQVFSDHGGNGAHLHYQVMGDVNHLN